MCITQQLVVNGVIAGGIYALVAVGFAVIYRTVKFFHLAHGAVYTVGAYAAYTLFISLRIPFLFSFFISLILAAALGSAIDRFVYSRLRKQSASNLILLLASFGVLIFFQNLIQLIYGAQILSLRTGLVREGYRVMDAVITSNQALILVVSLSLMVLIWFFLQKTRLGKAIRAVADSPVTASTVGINPERTILASFAIGSALAGASGILISFETNIEPTMGFNALLKGVIASIVGGIGSIPGASQGDG